jgi:hypothetical protein
MRMQLANADHHRLLRASRPAAFARATARPSVRSAGRVRLGASLPRWSATTIAPSDWLSPTAAVAYFKGA